MHRNILRNRSDNDGTTRLLLVKSAFTWQMLLLEYQISLLIKDGNIWLETKGLASVDVESFPEIPLSVVGQLR